MTIKMIEQIIKEVEEDLKKVHITVEMTTTGSNAIHTSTQPKFSPVDIMQISRIVALRLPSYNKQLLDGVEGEAKSILTSEGTLYCRDGIEICTECENPRRIRQFLSTLNKYGV